MVRAGRQRMTRAAALTLPGDEVLPEAGLVMDRLLDLTGPPDRVWPWLEQLGKRRAGWYLPGLVERFVPPSRRGARRIQQRWLGLTPGDRIPDWGPGNPEFEVLQIKRPDHLVYWSERARTPRRGVTRPPMRLTWALVLTPHGGSSSVLHLRLRVDLGHPAGAVARYGGGAMDWATVKLLERGLGERLRSG